MLNVCNLGVHTSTYKNLYLGDGWQGTKQPWPGTRPCAKDLSISISLNLISASSPLPYQKNISIENHLNISLEIGLEHRYV